MPLPKAAPARALRRDEPGRLVLVSLAFVVAISLVGCGSAATRSLDFRLPAGSRERGAVVFLVDGVNAETFEELLDKGELPAIRKYFVDRGLYVRRAVAGIPTITLVNQTCIITGRFPGHHGIVGNGWFDRNRLILRDYRLIAEKNKLDQDHRATTLFECLPDELTCSLFYQSHRGATKWAEDRLSAGPPFFFGWYGFIDELTLSRFEIVADLSRRYRQFAGLTMVYLLNADFQAYEHGTGSPQYRQALRDADRGVGRVLGDLERAGLLEKIHIALVSDHGHSDVTRHYSLARLLREQAGVNLSRDPVSEDVPFEARLATFDRCTGVCFYNGDRYAGLYLRKPDRRTAAGGRWHTWLVRPSMEDLKDYPARGRTIDLPSLLVSHDAVDAVCFSAGPDRARVQTKAGEVEFDQHGGAGMPIRYRLIRGTDPLGWRDQVSDDVLGGKALGPREWLSVTSATEYPDLPAQIVAYFRADRAADLAIFAAVGWDFGTRHRSGHGGVRAVDLRVPFILAGPGVPHEQRDTDVRTVDLMPTLLMLLGRPVPPGLDGKSLVSQPDHGDVR